jgi:hypothetical protein
MAGGDPEHELEQLDLVVQKAARQAAIRVIKNTRFGDMTCRSK